MTERDNTTEATTTKGETEGGFKNDTMKTQLKRVLAQITTEFLIENREELIKRAERRIKDEESSGTQTSFPKLD